MFDKAWSAMAKELVKRKKESGPRLGNIADEAIRDIRVPVTMRVDGLLGHGSSQTEFSIGNTVNELIEKWTKDWVCPASTSDHFLDKNLDIPAKLNLQDLVKDKGTGTGDGAEGSDLGSDSESDLEMDSDTDSDSNSVLKDENDSENDGSLNF